MEKTNEARIRKKQKKRRSSRKKKKKEKIKETTKQKKDEETTRRPRTPRNNYKYHFTSIKNYFYKTMRI